MPTIADLEKPIQQAADAIKALGASEVYVFGSAAAGMLHEYSDVDLAISGLPPAMFFKAMGQASDIIGRPVDMVDLDEDTLFVAYLKRKGMLRRVS